MKERKKRNINYYISRNKKVLEKLLIKLAKLKEEQDKKENEKK